MKIWMMTVIFSNFSYPNNSKLKFIIALIGIIFLLSTEILRDFRNRFVYH
jgi:hypothetical protein